MKFCKKNQTFFPLYAREAIREFGTTPFHRLTFKLLDNEIL
jgi:hypothetical protein